MYILKMYTGLKNKVIGEIFGVSLSAVNKVALRVSIQRRKQKGLGERIEKIAYSAFNRLSENTKSENICIDTKGLMTRKSAKMPILGQPVKV